MSKRKLPKLETLIDLYVNQKIDCGDICRMYGLSPNSRGNLLKRLKENGVTIRKQKGENHHSWKGGRIIKGDGYYGIWKPEHERADNQGYVYEHTLIYEKNKGVLPNKNEVLHHIDGNKLNNEFSNLYLCNNRKHLVCHRSIEKLLKPLLEKGLIKFENGTYKISE